MLLRDCEIFANLRLSCSSQCETQHNNTSASVAVTLNNIRWCTNGISMTGEVNNSNKIKLQSDTRIDGRGLDSCLLPLFHPL